MSSEGIIGPYYFENQRERALTVNSERYWNMLKNFLAPQLQEFEGFNAQTWFQLDGATCHTSNQSLAVVNQFFPQKVISCRGTIISCGDTLKREFTQTTHELYSN